MKKNILLTGAGGNVGIETLKTLLKKKNNYNIRIFDIKTKKNSKRLKPYLKYIQCFWGDITNYNDVLTSVKDTDFIIHTAAIIPPLADNFPKLAKKVNVNGTKNICKAINETNPETFLLYTSSISVYGDRTESPEITTFDKLKPSVGDYYALTKIKAENIIKLHLKNFSIFRLSAVMHPKMKLDPLFFHMPLNTSLEIITTRDLAFALVEAIDKKEYLNDSIFNIGGGKDCRISYEKFLKKNFEIFGLQKLNFPKYAFAEKNFHCGFYQDSNVLNEILHYQRDSIEEYLKQVKNTINPVLKYITKLFGKQIKKQLLKKSEPYSALKTRNSQLINQFFKNQTLKILAFSNK